MSKRTHILIFILIIIVSGSMLVSSESEEQNEQQLTDNMHFKYAPAVAVNNDIVHVVWQEDIGGGNHEIFYKNFNGNMQQEVVRLTNAEGRSRNPDIAVENNTVYVVWEDERDWNYEIYYMESSDAGKTWQEAVRLTNAPKYSRNPSIAVMEGIVHVVWSDSRDQDVLNNTHDEVYYKKFDGVWSDDLRLTYAPKFSWYPDITITNGDLHVVWQDDRDAGSNIYYKKFVGDNSVQPSVEGTAPMAPGWSDDIKLTESASAWTPKIASRNDTLYVVWRDGRDGTNEIYYKFFDPGTGWSSDMRLTKTVTYELKDDKLTPITDKLFYSENPDIAIDRDGAVYVAWVDLRRDNRNKEIYYKKFSDGAWSEDIQVTNNSKDSLAPAVTADTGMCMVWVDKKDKATGEVYYIKKGDGKEQVTSNNGSDVSDDLSSKGNNENLIIIAVIVISAVILIFLLKTLKK